MIFSNYHRQLVLALLFALGACTPTHDLNTPRIGSAYSSTPATFSEKSELYKTIKVRTADDSVSNVPLSPSGVTIVNLFNTFCSDCSTGSRLDMLEKIAKAHGQPGRAVAVFSETTFSQQDIENFQVMLNTIVPLYRGDLGLSQELTISEQLLLVFNAEGHLLWQEKPGMTEEEIAKQLAGLITKPR